MSGLYSANYGDPARPTILFLHGGGGGGWMWQPQVDALKQDYHLLVPDLPEHGRSAGIKPFTISGSVELIADLIRTQTLSGKAHVVGLSEGAQITVALLAAAPELMERAIVSSALVLPMPGMNWFGAATWKMAYRSIEPLNKYVWWARLNMRSNGIPPQYLQETLETYKTLTADAFAHIIVENQKFRLPVGLERIHIPTLVVGGSKEYKVMRQSVRAIAAAIPGAQARLVHHIRKLSLAEEHNWNMTTPDLFTQTVRAWMEGQALPSELQELN
ncbi:MAG TPA: alpha/beta fold hydrolase [Anaerolineales bacterium]|nr:alpha/beta fold hydrolase [Anaerolineales bacterium]